MPTSTDDDLEDDGMEWNRLLSKPLAFFFLILGANFVPGFAAATFGSDWIVNEPSAVAFTDRYMVTVVIVVSIVSAFYMTANRWSIARKRSITQWAAGAFMALAVTVILLGMQFLASVFGNPAPPGPSPDATRLTVVETRVGEIESGIQRIEARLDEAGMSPEARDAVTEDIEAQGYVTLELLDGLGLPQNMRQDVIDILAGSGYLRAEDVEVKLTIAAIEAVAADVMTREATCFVTALPELRRVNIRSTPSLEEDNWIGGLDETQQLEVVGHSGGTMNYSRWWLVAIPAKADQSEKRGWVHSSAVQEINEAACVSVPEFLIP